jgi:hypothetical protein
MGVSSKLDDIYRFFTADAEFLIREEGNRLHSFFNAKSVFEYASLG